jgi:hypothetical protein
MPGQFWSPSYFAAFRGGAPLNIIRHKGIRLKQLPGLPHPENRACTWLLEVMIVL